MIDLNALKLFTKLQQEQVKESYFNIASIAEIIGVMDMSDIVEKVMVVFGRLLQLI